MENFRIFFRMVTGRYQGDLLWDGSRFGFEAGIQSETVCDVSFPPLGHRAFCRENPTRRDKSAARENCQKDSSFSIPFCDFRKNPRPLVESVWFARILCTAQNPHFHDERYQGFHVNHSQQRLPAPCHGGHFWEFPQKMIPFAGLKNRFFGVKKGFG